MRIPTGRRASARAGSQAGTHASRQAGKQAGKQAGRQAGKGDLGVNREGGRGKLFTSTGGNTSYQGGRN